MSIVFLSLGSSIGNSCGILLDAIDNLKLLGEVEKTSSFYESAPVGGVAKNMFLNCCIRLNTTLSPEKLLDECQNIEKKHGRTRNKKWEDRTLDIDIITYDNIELNSPSLIIPHPLAYKRDFVLKPLSDIADFEILDKKVKIKF